MPKKVSAVETVWHKLVKLVEECIEAELLAIEALGTQIHLDAVFEFIDSHVFFDDGVFLSFYQIGRERRIWLMLLFALFC